MIRSMFRTLNELKSDIVVEKHLETSTTNYSKCAHRIKNMHMQNMSCTIIILYSSHGSSPVQSVTCHSKISNSAVTITANKIDANNKTIVS